MKKEAGQPESSITPRALQQRLDLGNPTDILDVRTPAEFSAAHLRGAQLVPLDQLDASEFLNKRLHLHHPLFVVCQSGNRARRAIEQFSRVGFSNCVLVEGGMDACAEAGLPVQGRGQTVLPLMRQVQITVGIIILIGATLALTIDRWFALIPLVMGCGLLFAGLSGYCGLAMLLAKMPWNRRGEDLTCCQEAIAPSSK